MRCDKVQVVIFCCSCNRMSVVIVLWLHHQAVDLHQTLFYIAIRHLTNASPMKSYIGIFCIVSFLLFNNCASSGGTAGTPDAGNRSNQVTVSENSAQSLADYLMRLPGVVVTGSGTNVKVIIRGTSTFTAGTDPLYVIDGQIAGTDYARVAAIVPVTQIERVEVLKGSDASAYGMRGANGVILITTRR
jgi:TonB-dependent SusC/RagA subfamily outer membrane receptor